MTTVRPNQVVARIVAGHQLLGEANGFEWMKERLGEARASGAIVDFDVLNSTVGIFGIQYVTFVVDVYVTEDSNVEVVKILAGHLLNSIVCDSDVEIHWVGTWS